jgi:putative FmdB family regulatory protein
MLGGQSVPLYEYECQKCGRHKERIEKVSGPHLKKCPHCGGSVERLLSRPAIQFKGSGWYVTDYAGKGANADGDKPETPAAELKEGASKDSSAEPSPKETSAKETRKSEEKKPAKKK